MNIMKRINGQLCRWCFNEPTHLQLSEDALSLYSGCDPMDIYEREAENEAGETIYRYAVTGTFPTAPGEWLSEAELNEHLEACKKEEDSFLAEMNI